MKVLLIIFSICFSLFAQNSPSTAEKSKDKPSAPVVEDSIKGRVVEGESLTDYSEIIEKEKKEKAKLEAIQAEEAKKNKVSKDDPKEVGVPSVKNAPSTTNENASSSKTDEKVSNDEAEKKVDEKLDAEKISKTIPIEERVKGDFRIVAPYENEEVGKWLKAEVDGFILLHPEVKVDFKLYPREDYFNIVSEYINEETSDVVFMNSPALSTKAMNENLFLEMNDVVFLSNQLFLLENYVNILQHDENFYGMPFTLNISGMYYRKDVLEEYDLKVPKTWNDFLAISEKLKFHGIIPLAISGNTEMLSLTLSYIALKKLGLLAYNALRAGELSYSDTSMESVFSAFKELSNKGYIHKNFKSQTPHDARLSFLEGQSAFLLDYSENLKVKDNETIGYIAFPSFQFLGSGNDGNIGVVETVHILRSTQHLKLSKQFIRYIYSHIKTLPNNFLKLTTQKSTYKKDGFLKAEVSGAWKIRRILFSLDKMLLPDKQGIYRRLLEKVMLNKEVNKDDLKLLDETIRTN